jgi:zinc protease
VKSGLTYGVSSDFSPGLHRGAFVIGLQTRPDQAAEALKVSRDVLAQIRRRRPHRSRTARRPRTT